MELDKRRRDHIKDRRGGTLTASSSALVAMLLRRDRIIEVRHVTVSLGLEASRLFSQVKIRPRRVHTRVIWLDRRNGIAVMSHHVSPDISSSIRVRFSLMCTSSRTLYNTNTVNLHNILIKSNRISRTENLERPLHDPLPHLN